MPRTSFKAHLCSEIDLLAEPQRRLQEMCPRRWRRPKSLRHLDPHVQVGVSLQMYAVWVVGAFTSS